MSGLGVVVERVISPPTIIACATGERWPGWEQAKKTLRESRQYDPETQRGVRQALAGSVLSPGQGHASLLSPRGGRRAETRLSTGSSRRHQFFTLCYPCDVRGKYKEIPPFSRLEEVAVGDPNTSPTSWCISPKRPQSTFEKLPYPGMHEGTTTARSCTKTRSRASRTMSIQPRNRRKNLKPHPMRDDGIAAFDLGIKTLATGVNDQRRFYHIGGFKSYRWYNKQLDKIRSKRDRCKKQSRRYLYLSRVYKRVAERKRNKQTTGLSTQSLTSHRRHTG